MLSAYVRMWMWLCACHPFVSCYICNYNLYYACAACRLQPTDWKQFYNISGSIRSWLHVNLDVGALAPKTKALMLWHGELCWCWMLASRRLAHDFIDKKGCVHDAAEAIPQRCNIFPQWDSHRNMFQFKCLSRRGWCSPSLEEGLQARRENPQKAIFIKVSLRAKT